MVVLLTIVFSLKSTEYTAFMRFCSRDSSDASGLLIALKRLVEWLVVGKLASMINDLSLFAMFGMNVDDGTKDLLLTIIWLLLMVFSRLEGM